MGSLAGGRHPFFEALRIRFFAAQNEAIEATFVDNPLILQATKGVGLNDILFILIQPVAGHARIAKPQHRARIVEHEPRITVAIDYANVIALKDIWVPVCADRMSIGIEL